MQFRRRIMILPGLLACTLATAAASAPPRPDRAEAPGRASAPAPGRGSDRDAFGDGAELAMLVPPIAAPFHDGAGSGAGALAQPMPPFSALPETQAVPEPVPAEPVPPGATPMDLVRANAWSAAEAAAAAYADPVAGRLVTYYRLLAPGAAHAAEIARFMADYPDWPNQQLLFRRLQEALAADGDDRTVLLICLSRPVSAVPSLLRCSEAAGGAGRKPDAEAAARRAWIGGIDDPGSESGFLRVWGRVITAQDQWRRFDRLAWTDAPGLRRQLARLDLTWRRAAIARLALRHDDPKALALVAALPPVQRGDPTMILEEARWLRHAKANAAAFALWCASGTVAERTAPPERLAAFWTERDMLARALLQSGDAAGAYALAARHAQTDPERVGEAEFLAGWIALRRLHDPARAEPHFRALTTLSHAAITQARAHYWLGRTAAARGDQAGAAAEYAAAAAWPTTYYGQMAVHALGEDEGGLDRRLLAAHDPAWEPPQALDFAGRDLARAAELLVAWGEGRRARAFLLRLQELAHTDTERSLAANLALGLGLPSDAVAIARLAGRDGVMLPGAGWPVAVRPPGLVESALALALIRQESNFDPEAGSPVGARGLMQLMPATARIVAAGMREVVSVAALTADPDYNMRLGSAYLKGLLDRFGGTLPYAIAAYNAGPGRVQDWLTANGDPAAAHGDPAAAHGETAAGIDMIDWVELIPFTETRNYVQRVIENVVIYRARLGAAPAFGRG